MRGGYKMIDFSKYDLSNGAITIQDGGALYNEFENNYGKPIMINFNERQDILAGGIGSIYISGAIFPDISIVDTTYCMSLSLTETAGINHLVIRITTDGVSTTLSPSEM